MAHTADNHLAGLGAADPSCVEMHISAVVASDDNLNLLPYHVRFTAYNDQDDSVDIGSATVWQIDHSAGWPLRDAAEHGGDIYATIERLWLEGNANPDMFIDWAGPVLFIERIEFDPQYRGRGLGHWAAKRIVAALGRSADRVVIEPAPIVAEPSELTDDARTAAASKLAAHWAELGFTELTGPLMVADLTYRMPLTDS